MLQKSGILQFLEHKLKNYQTHITSADVSSVAGNGSLFNMSFTG